MLQKTRSKSMSSKLNKKGFSLVEILIAIGILALIVVPLAVNLITSSRFNSKAKQKAAASDLATSILDTLQTVSIGDILIDINTQLEEHKIDETGQKLPYTLTGNTLSGYEIHYKAEVIKVDDKYVPVTEETSSISVDKDANGKVNKVYFNKNAAGEYAFITNVENDNINVDVLVTIELAQLQDIVDINSMAQTNLITVKQQTTMDMEVANEFKRSYDSYIATHTQTGNSLDVDWFLNHMTRKMIITIERPKDEYGLAAQNTIDVKIDAEYEIACEHLTEADKKIVKSVGSFRKNSINEFNNGIYLYYTPLLNSGSTRRDNFVINNKDKLTVPIYLIAVNNNIGENAEEQLSTNYNPSLSIDEDTYAPSEYFKTIVCSNIAYSSWKYSEADGQVTIKTIGNPENQESMYSINIKIYNHRNGSYENGEFTPRSKDLLVEINGSSLNSDDKIINPNDHNASGSLSKIARTIIHGNYTFDGAEHCGVSGENVLLQGQASATDAGTYIVHATPKPGFAWANGTTGTTTIIWEISRATINIPTMQNHNYSATRVCGVKDIDKDDNRFIGFTGTTHATNADNYVVFATPDKNHMWLDGTYETKSFQWSISPLPATIVWIEDTWSYNGQTHHAVCEVSGLLPEDDGKCNAILENNSIKNVGTKTVSVVGLDNKNYVLDQTVVRTHTIKVVPTTNASFVLANPETLVYNGKVQYVVTNNVGCTIEGIWSARNAGTYNCVIRLDDEYTWSPDILEQYGYSADQVGNSIEIEWTINKRTVDLKWGTTHSTYDGELHSTTCTAQNIISGDRVNVELSYYHNGNLIQNANNFGIRNVIDSGKITVVATGLTNDNYQLPDNTSVQLTMSGAPYAIYDTQNFNYDGYSHTGVFGQYIVPSENATRTNVNVEIVNGKRVVAPYVCTIRPDDNYTWARNTIYNGVDIGGTTVSIQVEWTIYPIKDANVTFSDYAFSGREVEGVWGNNFDYGPVVGNANIYNIWGEEYDRNNNGIIDAGELDESLNGVIKATALGKYGVTVTPKQNHAWSSDGSVEARIITWEIVPTVTNKPYIVDEKVVYDGRIHVPNIPGHLFSPQYTMTIEGPYVTNPNNIYALHAGTYYIRCSLVDKNGMSWSDGSTDDVVLEWVIHPKPVEIYLDRNSWEYDGLNHNADAYIDDDDICYCVLIDEEGNVLLDADGNMLKEKDTYTLKYTYDQSVRINADDYDFYIVGITNGENDQYSDYCLKNEIVSGSIKITPKPVTINWGQTEFEYDGREKKLRPTLYNVIDGDDYELILDGNGLIEIGSTSVVVIDISNDNYLLPEDESERTATLTVKRGKALVSIPDAPIPFNHQTHTIQTQGVIFGQGTITSASEVGTYHIYARPDDYHEWADGGRDEREFIWKIEAYGTYYVGVTSTYLDVDGYHDSNVTVYTNDTFPATVSTGDIYVLGNYEYRYNCFYNTDNKWKVNEEQNGWGVRVLYADRVEYGAILKNINGQNVTNMSLTFAQCELMVSSPEIPNTVTVLSGTFMECSNLSVAPDIPNGVINMASTFALCPGIKSVSTIPDSVVNMAGTFEDSGLTVAPLIPSSVKFMNLTFVNCNLTGTIIINANPTTYDACFAFVDFEVQSLILAGNSDMLDNLGATGKNYCEHCDGYCRGLED